MKKILSLYVAISFLFTGGNAHALIPLVPGVVPLLTYLGATTTLATALDYSLVLHAGILAIAFNRDAEPVTSSTSGKLTVRLNPKTPLPTPSGWTAPVAPSVSPTPPAQILATTNPNFINSANHDVICNTAFFNQGTVYLAANGNSYQAAVGAASTALSADGWGNTGACGNGVLMVKYIPPSGCPDGYTASGSNCNLTNSAVVQQPSNDNCQIVRVGNTYSAPDNDPDCATNSPTMSGATVTPNTVSMTRSDGSVATVTINPDGTTTASESYPDIPNSKTHTLTTNYSAPNPSTGEVTLTGISTGSTPGVGTGTSGGSGQSHGPTGDGQIVVDKLTAQDAAAAAAAAGNSQLPENPSKVSDLGLPQSNPYNSDFSGLSLPSSSGGCVNLEIDLPYLGHLSISPCQVVDAVAPMVNYLIISLGVIGGVAVWIRPSGGEA